MPNHNILAYTWNLSGSDTSMSRKKWKKSASGEEWKEFLKEELAEKGPPSLVVLALQEWDSSNGFHKAFGDWLSELTGRKYVRVTHQLRSRLASLAKFKFSQLLNIYYLPKNKAGGGGGGIVSRVKPIGVTCFGKRILGKNRCDKGSLGINVTVLGRSVIFVGSHFPFDKVRPYYNNARNSAFKQTMKAMKLEEGAAFQNFPVVWLGDLNYRMIKHGKELKLQDDLRFSRNTYQVFTSFLEGPLPEYGRQGMPPDELTYFHPTCKMIQWRADADPKMNWDQLRNARANGNRETAYVDDREPSYCDRILVRRTMRNLLTTETYNFSAKGTNLSDHNAVASSIIINWNMPKDPMSRGQYLRDKFVARRAEQHFQADCLNDKNQVDILIETEIHTP